MTSSRFVATAIPAEPTRRLMDNSEVIGNLERAVGKRFVLTKPSSTRRFRKGFRFGLGDALAVVRPGSLLEQWRVLNICAAAGKIVIVQAANTGLTGGSTPDGSDYDRDVVIISTLRIDKIHLINSGQQVVCLPGATLFELEKLLHPLGRNPHSVIGSSCIGASIFGGICNNSGGALIHRGPAFTQMALYAQIDLSGQVHLVNHLGIRLGTDSETILRRVEEGNFCPEEIEEDPTRLCSDHDYQQHVRDIEADTPARFNADPKRLFEASGSGGKVMLLAVRLDTFPKEQAVKDFYIGTNNPDDLTKLRREMLSTFKTLPVEAEYLHRDAFAIAATYGKDTFLSVQYLGTARLPLMFALKGRLDSLCERLGFLPHDLSDRMMQFLSSIFPRHLPNRLYEYHSRYEHHLMLRVADDGIDEARNYLTDSFPTADGDFFECDKEEGEQAFLHRFAAAGAAIRYRAIHRQSVQDIVALDIALPRNGTTWFEQLPDEIASGLIHKLYYGHFFCQVFHQDYIVSTGQDTDAIERAMWKLLDKRRAEYPAEHNVGHLYFAKPALLKHYMTLDPSNSFNAGLGRSSKCVCWR
jgi:D-lactate dehydrogenase (quinone)